MAQDRQNGPAKRGFAAMDRAKQREIASKGGESRGASAAEAAQTAVDKRAAARIAGV